MKRTVAVIAIGLLLTGCTRTSVAELAKHKQECEAAGGSFSNWEHDFGSNWKCDLSTKEDHGGDS